MHIIVVMASVIIIGGVDVVVGDVVDVDVGRVMIRNVEQDDGDCNLWIGLHTVLLLWLLLLSWW